LVTPSELESRGLCKSYFAATLVLPGVSGNPSELLIVRWGSLRYEAFICNLALFYEDNFSEYGTLRGFFQPPHHLGEALLAFVSSVYDELSGRSLGCPCHL
jgi:hypothetical protein